MIPMRTDFSENNVPCVREKNKSADSGKIADSLSGSSFSPLTLGGMPQDKLTQSLHADRLADHFGETRLHAGPLPFLAWIVGHGDQRLIPIRGTCLLQASAQLCYVEALSRQSFWNES